jgi:hypothetical protein
MIPVIKFTPDRQIKDYAGVYVEALTDTVPPGRLPVDGSLVKIATFPTLFDKLGHLYTSGSKAGNGTEGDSFRLPSPAGRFLKPRDDGSLPGALTEDRTSDHTHSVSGDPAGQPDHPLTNVPNYGSQFHFDHSYHSPGPDDDPDAMDLRGTYGTATFYSGYGGDHSHSFTLNSSDGVETRPYSARLPGFIITGELSNRCVAIIYGSDWGVQPGFNEVVPAKTGIEMAFARENVHTYRLRYPESTVGAPKLTTAHVELCKQLKKLRSMYADVWIIGIGVGAHLAAMAMTVEEKLWVATKFVGINGFYNPSGLYAASLTQSLTNYLGGTTQDLKDQATPILPYYPTKLWHGANNTVTPISQAQWFTDQVVSVPSLAWDGNPITAGLFADIFAFLSHDDSDT